MKTVIKTTSPHKRTLGSDLVEGQLAKVVEPSSYVGEIVLRVYDGVVSLTDPEHIWSLPTILEVEPLPKGTVVEITSEV